MRNKTLPSLPSYLLLVLLLSGTFCNRHNMQYSGKEKTIVIQNYYYAKPGKEEEVLQWRIHACEVLKEIGVKPGRVMKCIPKTYADVTPREQPDVIWTVEYPDTASLNRDRQLLRNSGKFEPVMEHMGTLIRDFNRIASEVQR